MGKWALGFIVKVKVHKVIHQKSRFSSDQVTNSVTITLVTLMMWLWLKGMITQFKSTSTRAMFARPKKPNQNAPTKIFQTKPNKPGLPCQVYQYSHTKLNLPNPTHLQNKPYRPQTFKTKNQECKRIQPPVALCLWQCFEVFWTVLNSWYSLINTSVILHHFVGSFSTHLLYLSTAIWYNFVCLVVLEQYLLMIFYFIKLLWIRPSSWFSLTSTSIISLVALLLILTSCSSALSSATSPPAWLS